ncbi:serine/threonine protein kinase [Streptosporangium sp. NPDC004379]|uniref:serine/threonine protein kinase n=1 Tax=Streptosporangium sp. NPDC004379 TaxID=3366189 RepID=UPI00368C919F
MLSLLSGDPREIGPYRLVGRLGAGGMGVVYAGVDDTGRRVAVKLVHEPLSVDLEFRRRFSREISVLDGVEGVCLARVLGSDPGTERPWLATEYIPGPTIEQHVRAGGPLSGDALYGLAAGVAEALVAMHAAGVVHRDLKPSNVILAPDGPRLIDFGIAKVLDGGTVTHTGTLVGSPGWISPEEYGEGSAGTPADVYGWALLVLFTVTGEPPYGAGRPEVLAYRVREETPDTGAVPADLRDLVERALAKDPAERPAAAEVLAGVTDAWRNRADGTAEPEADATAMIQRTWVLSPGETTEWPEPPAASPATVAAAPVPKVPEVPAAPEVKALPAGDSAEIARGRSGPSWVHAYIATAAAAALVAVTAIIAAAATSSPAEPLRERSNETTAGPKALAQFAATTPPAPVSGSPTPATAQQTSTGATEKARTVPRSGGEAVSFRGIAMTLPKGWRLLRVRKDLACIESPNARGSSGPWELACRPDAMVLETGSGPDSWPGRSIDDPYSGWAIGDPAPCLAGGSVFRDPNGSYDDQDIGEFGLYYGVYGDGARLRRSSLARMSDGRKAAYREWSIPCMVNIEYTMKIWHLPKSKVSFYVLSARPEDAAGYRRIISSVDLSGYRYAAPL